MKVLKSLFHSHKVLTAIIGGGSIGITALAFLVYEIQDLKDRLRIPVSATDREKIKSYIFIRNQQLFSKQVVEKDFGEVSHNLKYVLYHSLPSTIAKWKYHYQKILDKKDEFNYMTAWEILELLSLKDENIRKETINKISTYKQWHDEALEKGDTESAKYCEERLGKNFTSSQFINYEYKLLSERLDPTALVSLARTKDADSRLFKQSCPVVIRLKNEESIEDELREVLVKLPQEDVDDICLNFFTREALQMSDERQLKRGGLWCFGGNGINYTREVVSQEQVESFCLQALVKHSKLLHHCTVMVNNGILSLLQHIRLLRPHHGKIQRNIVRIISNICVHPQLHSDVLKSGWIPILAELSKSEQVALRMQASRALANLDRKAVDEVYEDGVYLIHPRHRISDGPSADIVFVHGLMGGAFHSWRQQEVDSNPTTRDYTLCWPETWLPRDIPNVRVICVEYDTHLNEWMAPCPHNKHKHKISFRSREILDKLYKAGVGKDRPIIWLTHSMGGLIVKRLLKDAIEDNKFKHFIDNTKGILFYSTPHFGTQLAQYSRKIRYLFFPSVEVMELSHDSLALHSLNEDFIRLANEKEIKVLSFGETKMTSVGMGLNMLIVKPSCSNPGIGEHLLVDVDHLNICKPSSSQSELYQKTVTFCQQCLTPTGLVEDLKSVPKDILNDISSVFS